MLLINFASDNMERDLIKQITLLSTIDEYSAWKQRCDEFIKSLEEQSRIKRPRLSIGNRQLLIACIVRLWRNLCVEDLCMLARHRKGVRKPYSDERGDKL